MSGKAACVQFVVYRKAEWVDDMEPLPCSFRSTMTMKPGRYVGCSAAPVTPHWARCVITSRCWRQPLPTFALVVPHTEPIFFRSLSLGTTASYAERGHQGRGTRLPLQDLMLDPARVAPRYAEQRGLGQCLRADTPVPSGSSTLRHRAPCCTASSVIHNGLWSRL